MFADDIVLFGEASKDQARIIQECIQQFCALSGQKVSAAKSSIFFSPNTTEDNMVEVCNILNIQRTKDFGKYLGVPTINGRVSKAMYQGVVTRVDQKLAGWKTRCLSLAGRATLIKAAVEAIPAYTMQTSRIPRSICDELDRKIRRFLWGASEKERKIHLVAWKVVTAEKE